MKSLQIFHLHCSSMVSWPLCSSILFTQKEREEKNGSRATNGQQQQSLLYLKLMKFFIRIRGGHRNGQIEQNCAINCGIKWNATNKSITKYENLFGVKSIFESLQRFAIYRIGALILTGRLCTSLGNVSSHFLQLNGFSLVWILSCSLRLLPSLASVHGVWFVSEWFSIFWLFSFNVCLQFEQVNGFSLEESLSWSFKAVLSNFWSHLAQLNVNSIVWARLCSSARFL